MIPKVTEWLEAQGFTLEMRTAAAFRAAGFEVRQSSHYIDPESGKGREIDVIAVDTDPLMLGVIEIGFIIECKSSKKPWALLSSPDTLVGYNRIRAFCVFSENAFDSLFTRFTELLERWPWLKKSGLAAYSVRQAMSDSDVAYAAAVAVAKASNFYAHRPESKYASTIFAFPIIVVNSPILECRLSENGQIEIQEVAEGEWLFFAQLPNFFGTCIRVVSIDRLPEFATEAKALALKIREDLKGEQDKILASWSNT